MYHIGDFILRIKNAYLARKKQVEMPFSNLCKAVALALIKEGFLAKVEESEKDGHRILIAHLRYENRKPSLTDVKLISKPSIRVYIDNPALARDKDRHLTSFLSTSTGIMTGREALKKGVGGELLFKIW